MKEYKVIYIDFPLPSFKWGNGLYAIINEVDGILEMSRLDNGIPERFKDGRFMLTMTSKNNTGITNTDLILKV